jgi:hypothetical protein
MSRIERAEAANCEQPWTSEKRSSPSLKIENAAGRRFEQIEPGIYRSSRNGKYFERPLVNGKRTWRSLGGKNLKFAKEEFYRRRAAVSAGKNPYAEVPSKGTQVEAKTVGEVIRRYQQDNYLDSNLLSRPDGTRADEERHWPCC